MMSYGVEYVKRDEEAYAAEVLARLEKSFHRRAMELGNEVKKIESSPESRVGDTPLSA